MLIVNNEDFCGSYVAVDCGGTWSKGVGVEVAAGGAAVVSAAAAGSTNPNVVGAETALESLIQLLRDILVGVDLLPVRRVVVGGSTPETIRQAVRVVFGDSVDLIMSSDAVLPAFTSLSWGDGNPVVSLVSGTGSMVSRVSGNNVVTAGGWGWFLGDEGSANHLGREALRVVLRELENGVSSKLTCFVADRFNGGELGGLESKIFEAVYRGAAPHQVTRSFAPAVTRFAAEGERNACEVRDTVVKSLVELALKVWQAGDAVVTSGSVACALEPELRLALSEATGNNNILFVPDGVVGAAALALGPDLAQLHRNELLTEWGHLRQTFIYWAT